MSSEGLNLAPWRAAITWLAAMFLSTGALAQQGAVAISLTSGYRHNNMQQFHQHSGVVGCSLEVGISRLAALRLATHFAHAPSVIHDEGPARNQSNMASTLGVNILLDTLPDLDPYFGIDSVIMYAPIISDPNTELLQQIYTGAAVRVGLDYALAHYVKVGGVASYTMLAPITAATAETSTLENLFGLSLRLTLFVDPMWKSKSR